jgi:YfiH family protein
MFITHELPLFKNIHYKFFTKNVPGSHRYFNNHDGHEQNNKEIAKLFGCEKIAFVEQKHTNKVIITNDYNSYCIADAQVTNKPNIALAVVTADCVPILLADDENKVIASVHAGWRGARADIIKEAVTKMKGLGAKNIIAFIGPCIRQESYEVDSNFYQDFISESESYKKFFIPGNKPDYFMFDLPSYVKSKLNDLNIEEIFDTNRNTYEEEDKFFSFRRTTHNPNSPMGNLVSAITLKD